jgi:hypothetical protein
MAFCQVIICLRTVWTDLQDHKQTCKIVAPMHAVQLNCLCLWSPWNCIYAVHTYISTRLWSLHCFKMAKQFLFSSVSYVLLSWSNLLIGYQKNFRYGFRYSFSNGLVDPANALDWGFIQYLLVACFRFWVIFGSHYISNNFKPSTNLIILHLYLNLITVNITLFFPSERNSLLILNSKNIVPWYLGSCVIVSTLMIWLLQ